MYKTMTTDSNKSMWKRYDQTEFIIQRSLQRCYLSICIM